MTKNMTALISCFVRYYHTKYSNIKIYSDVCSEKILSNKEIKEISESLKNGISFFNPTYKGNDPLKWIVNYNLAPSVLIRSKITENHLLNEIDLGLKQYVVLASGYDTSAFKVNNKVKVFELDKPEIIEDKMNRINKAKIDTTNITYIKTDFNKKWICDLLNTNFNNKEKTLCSMLGISYYLDKKIFEDTIKVLSENIPKGSTIIFDYPNYDETKKEVIIKQLAAATNENMKSLYSYIEIEKLAEKNNMLVYEHLNNDDINNTILYDYNTINPNDKIVASPGVSYCIMVKQ